MDSGSSAALEAAVTEAQANELADGACGGLQADIAESHSDQSQVIEVTVNALLSGQTVGVFSLPRGTLVSALKDLIAARDGMPISHAQKLLVGSQSLTDRMQLHELSAATSLELTLIRVEQRNLALASQGATAAAGGDDYGEKPLIRHDEAFPYEEWGIQQMFCNEDPDEAVPTQVRERGPLGRHLAASKPGSWDGDAKISTFLPNDGAVTVNLANTGGLVTRVGFSYSPWDRNNGTICEVWLSKPGSDFHPAGRVDIPRHLGGPEVVRTLFMELPSFSAEPTQAVRFRFLPGGRGRRLFFLYVIGYAC